MAKDVWITIDKPELYPVYVDGVKIDYRTFTFCIPAENAKQFAINVREMAKTQDERCDELYGPGCMSFGEAQDPDDNPGFHGMA